MLNKRIIGVVAVKDGWAVQSFGYHRYLPLGKPECLVENLDRWGSDEIGLLCFDRSRKGGGPDFETLEKVGKLGLSTPLVYGGGIRSVEDAVKVIQSGADRICMDALLRDAPATVEAIAKAVGAQAIIASLPVRYVDGGVLWLDYRTGAESPLPPELCDLFERGLVSEMLIMDWKNEGTPRGFDERLPAAAGSGSTPLIVFGGISENDQAQRLLADDRVVAVAVGNFLSYSEHAVQSLKSACTGLPVRNPHYASAR